MIKVAVIDDHDITLEGLKTLFKINEEFIGIHLVYTCNDPVQFLDFINGGNKVNVVLLDMRMKGLDGIQFLRVLKAFKSQVRCIMYTSYSETSLVAQAISEGAIGYLNKQCTFEQLKSAIEGAHRFGFHFGDDMDADFAVSLYKEGKLHPQFPSEYTFTPAEQHLITTIANGTVVMSGQSVAVDHNDEFGQALEHLKSITGLVNTADFAVLAASKGWV